MNKEFDIHPIQAAILRELLFVTSAGFSELNKKKLGTDLFSFHLKQLINWKLIIKTENKYGLTTKGKEFANRFDTDTVEVEKQPKITMLIIGNKMIGGKKYFLMQQRLKQPYFGFWGFITGKIRWGETLTEGVCREFREETGLIGQYELAGIKHKMDYDQENKLLEDKYFLLMRATKLTGKLKVVFEGGKNKWLTIEEIRNLPDLFDGVEETIQMSLSKKMDFSEIKYRVKRY